MSEVSLREFQQWMKKQIRSGGTTAAEAEAPVNPQRGTSGEARVTAVYGGAYVARMQEALAEVFEAVRFVLGERTFTQLAHEYAACYPSHDYNLSFAGRHLPELLASSPLSQPPPSLGPTRDGVLSEVEGLPFLQDLARLEWLVCQAFHAFDEPPADVTPLAELSLEQWQRARPIFQPSVSVIASSWPIRDIWASRVQPRHTLNLDLINRPQRVLVHREGQTVTCELLEERPYVLLERLLAGDDLGAACAALARLEGTERFPASDWFARWARHGLIARIEHS